MLKMETGGGMGTSSSKPERKVSPEEEASKKAEIRKAERRAQELSLEHGLPVIIEGTGWVAIDGNLYPVVTVTANGIGEPLVRQPGEPLPENIFE